MDIASYAQTWVPFQCQWSMDKANFLGRFEETQPRPENFHAIISKYAEIANQISMQNEDDSRLAIHYVQLNVTALKSSLIRHIDEWQRLHMDLLARRSFEKLDLIYQQIGIMSKQIEAQPMNRQEMIETLQLHEGIVQTQIPGLEERFTEARNHFRIMGNRSREQKISGPVIIIIN